jgi:hypothetical protein
MPRPGFLGNLGLVDDGIGSDLDHSRQGGPLYGGTMLWAGASFVLGWLPLLWLNNWTPRNVWLSVLLVALFVVLGVATLGWWFLVGWCFALTARMRRNAIILGALVCGIGIIAESAVQLSGPFGAVTSLVVV